MGDDVVTALEALGFSLNESRAYAALALESPATGYEVGVRAGIPRSAVYAVLRRLVNTGAARSISGSPERFAPAPSADLIQLLRRRFDHKTVGFEDAIAKLAPATKAPDAYSVHGYARVLEEADQMVRGAETRLVLSGWPRELAELTPELKRASKRRVHVVVFSHGDPRDLPGELFTYGLPERELETFWKHRLVVVADDKKALIGATERAATDSAVISATDAIAELATSQVALDITLLAQRKGLDVEGVMAKMLGPRVGKLDTLLDARGPKKNPENPRKKG